MKTRALLPGNVFVPDSADRLHNEIWLMVHKMIQIYKHLSKSLERRQTIHCVIKHIQKSEL